MENTKVKIALSLQIGKEDSLRKSIESVIEEIKEVPNIDLELLEININHDYRAIFEIL